MAGKFTPDVRETSAVGIMGDPSTPRYHSAVMFGGFQGWGALNWVPMMPRDVSFSDICTPDRYFFPSLADKQKPENCLQKRTRLS